MRDQLTSISQALWELSHGLYPSNLEYLGLAPAVKRMCSELREQTGLRLQCESQGIADWPPADVSLCLFRIAQEGLQNVIRHSQATHASVRLHTSSGRVWLHITDDGVGFDERTVALGLGFASIRERLKAMDGDFTIDSAPGRGTRLEAWVRAGKPS